VLYNDKQVEVDTQQLERTIGGLLLWSWDIRNAVSKVKTSGLSLLLVGLGEDGLLSFRLRRENRLCLAMWAASIGRTSGATVRSSVSSPGISVTNLPSKSESKCYIPVVTNFQRDKKLFVCWLIIVTLHDI